MARNNRELSQFSAFLHIEDLPESPSIISLGATEFTGFSDPPLIGIGTTGPDSILHIAVGTTDVIISGNSPGGGLLLDGNLVSRGSGYIKDTLYVTAQPGSPGGQTAIEALYGDVVIGGNITLDYTSSSGIRTESDLYINASEIGITTNTILAHYGPSLFYNDFETTGITSLRNNVRITAGLGATQIESESISTGLLTVEGGVGIAGSVHSTSFVSDKFLVTDGGTLTLESNTELFAQGATQLNFLDVNNELFVSGIATIGETLYLTQLDDSFDLTTGSLLIEGGVAIKKQLRVGTGLTVEGSIYSANGLYAQGPIARIDTDTIFLGVTTASSFAGSGIIRVNSEFDSSLIPYGDSVYDLGNLSNRWANVRAVNITSDDISVDSQLIVSGNITVGGDAQFTNGINVSGATGNFSPGINVSGLASITNLDVTGFAAFTNDISGTIENAKRAIAVDVSVASTDKDYYFTFNDSFLANPNTTLFVDVNTKVNPITGDVGFGGNLSIGGTILDSTNGIDGFFTLFDNSVTSVRAFSNSLSISVGSTNGITTVRSDLVDIQGNALQIGLGATAAIKSAGVENITMTGNTLTELAGSLSIGGTTLSVLNDLLYFADENVTSVSAFGFADQVLLGSDSVGYTSIRNPLFIIAGDIRINGDQIQASTGDVNIDMTGADLTRFAGDIQVDGGDILVSGGTTHITMVGSQKAVFVGDIEVGGNDIRASDGNINITMLSNTLTSIVGQLRVESNEIIDTGNTLNMTLGTNYVQFENDIRINGDSIRASDNAINLTLDSDIRTVLSGNLQLGNNIIEASDGAEAIEVVPVYGSVGIKSDLTIENDVYVKGSDVIIRSDTIKIRDRLIDIGMGIDTTSATALVVPQQDDDKDIGILFNYYDLSSKKAAIFWDDSRNSVGIASDVTEVSEVLTVNSYAKIDVKNITIHDCAGTSDLILCDEETSTRSLINVVIDGGTY